MRWKAKGYESDEGANQHALPNARQDQGARVHSRFRRERIDFYLVHCINKRTWPGLVEMGVFDFLDQAKASGRIGRVGFSSHDNPQDFREVVDAYDWEFCQIQCNCLDENFQAGREGLDLATAKGKGIVTMEPPRGGKLVADHPEEVLEAFATSRAKKTSPSSGACRSSSAGG